ncbi:hypothetical protein RMATCC62417_11650 [Rhizopus microsporus]|nr:hypothetical protein RMATCC62417_11650 [Rhizopus microsporus]
MFNKSLISIEVKIYWDEWSSNLEYSNFILNGHVVELLCGFRESQINPELYYQIDWKRLNPDHNEIIRAVYELPPHFKGYFKDITKCNGQDLKEMLKLDEDVKPNQKNVNRSKKYPNYTFEMYTAKKKINSFSIK